jgi:hypothetical protein
MDLRMDRNVRNQFESNLEDLDLALALRRLDDASEPPPIDPRREAALLAAFDAAQHQIPRRRPYWGMAGLAAAAALLIAVALPVRAGRHGSPIDGMATRMPLPSSSRGVQPEPLPPMEFVLVPGAAALPPMESGSLVRMEIPVSMLPSLGLTPPAASVTAVRADVIVGQDGLKRAVRLVD